MLLIIYFLSILLYFFLFRLIIKINPLSVKKLSVFEAFVITFLGILPFFNLVFILVEIFNYIYFYLEKKCTTGEEFLNKLLFINKDKKDIK